jgi:cellulose synthase/poly-beta-1,6-N-acetylglucosamine synthase-like glycosyltransferase
MSLQSIPTTVLISAAIAYAVAVLVTIAEQRRQAWPRQAEASALVLAVAAATVVARLVSGATLVPLCMATGWLGVSAAVRARSGDFRVGGLLLLVSYPVFAVTLVVWSGWFVVTLPVSTLTKSLMLSAFPLLIVFAPVALVRTYENWEVLCRTTWRRPRDPSDAATLASWPMVSIHVPAYSEPPELVIGTLDALARLDYPNFEVLLVDNNTPDPRLWQPVERHCGALGSRFRFIHVEGLTGAKAGALNLALRETDPDAELIAVVDADYHVEPEFLSRTIGHFENPKMGFVQGPHAYRGHERSRYLSMCNWEYAYYFATALVSLNERNAAITVGTMSVIRRQALDQAGGWAEWCLTEDSELAVRLHALGYVGVYTSRPLGRGLIPPTFAGYRRQRFRWSYGPVQELRRHHRLFLPGPWRQQSRLTRIQRIHHASHGLHNISLGSELLAVPLAAAVLASMAAHHETVRLPFALWLAWTVILIGDHTLRLLTYRTVLDARLRDAVGAFIASSALMHVIRIASLQSLFGRDAAWRRTDKIPARRQGLAAIKTAPAELTLGLTYLTLAGAVIVLLRHSSFAVALAVGISMQAVLYLAAPAMALLADRDLRRSPASTADAPRPLPARLTPVEAPTSE